MNIQSKLCSEFGIQDWQVKNTVELIEGGATIPFISRYRKEVTGSLDDATLRLLSERLEYLQNLEKRKGEVISLIESQGKLTDELRTQINSSAALVEVEDIYRPYKPKRRTRGMMAREKGLEPLAQALVAQSGGMKAPLELAKDYIDEEKGVKSAEDALAGALDIIAEDISDNAAIRTQLRDYIARNGALTTAAAKGKEKEESVYSAYYQHSEPYIKAPGHRVLAINRGEKEGFLKVSVELDKKGCASILYSSIIKGESAAKEHLIRACDDAFARLIFPSLENELRASLSEKACDGAINVFSKNLHQLLMQPPVKGRVVLGLDPAYRTGCKIAVVDYTGKVLATTVVYPTPPQSKTKEAAQTLQNLILKHSVSVISIGNGTASKESELFVAELISDMKNKAQLSYMVVSEAGASVYSASALASEEFPEFDVSLRSAISIARRIQDPLAELVKIDPKAIGVGQYQHDMPPSKLDASLGGVVENCVNTVGVDLNTASHSLLSYVAGIGGSLAKNIVRYREENGAFLNRKQLLKVPKLGPKAFEQCAGFLRVREGKQVLDSTGVHPESYPAAQKLLEECGFTLVDVKSSGLTQLKARVSRAGAENLAKKIGVGLPTLEDIIEELLKPGRDPRENLPPPILRTDVLSISDLKPEMILKGTVRNVIDFGVFVDIGVHQDGLVHISQLADRYVKHPLDVVKVGDIVDVKVLSVDEGKKRISLTMKGIPSD